MSQQLDALARANQRRREIHRLLVEIHSLQRRPAIDHVSRILCDPFDDPALGAVRVERLLLAIRGIGAGRVDELLGTADITHRRLRETTREQRELLAGLLRAEVKA